MKTSGSYGVILSAATEDGQRVVIKMYNLGSSDGVDPKDLPWFNIPASRFQLYCRTLSLLSDTEPDIVPAFLGCNIVSLGRDAVFGLLFMTDRGETDLFHALHRAGKKARRALARAAGETLRRLHDSCIAHGDAHAGNFVVDGPVSVAVDLDMAIIFTRRDSRLDFCKRFDVCTMMRYLDTADMSAVREAFAEGYTGKKKGVQSFVEQHITSEEGITEQRKVYDSLHSQIMVGDT